MDITFKDRKFQKDCESDSRRIRTCGPRRARVLQQRLDDLAAAETLEDFRPGRSVPPLPGRCHLLTNRHYEFSLDLDHPWRLILSPAELPPVLHPEGSVDWAAITAVCILRIEDTHD